MLEHGRARVVLSHKFTGLRYLSTWQNNTKEVDQWISRNHDRLPDFYIWTETEVVYGCNIGMSPRYRSRLLQREWQRSAWLKVWQQRHQMALDGAML